MNKEVSLKEKALWDLYYKAPSESAYMILYSWQVYTMFALFLLIAVLFLIYPITSLITFSILINLVFFILNPIKLFIGLRAFNGGKASINISDKEVAGIEGKSLPIYTILVPVYKEGNVLKYLLDNLARLDYPKSKLDIKLLMEEKDTETISAAKKLGVFNGKGTDAYAIDPIIVSGDIIRTKARACNYGLQTAKGEYCVIYDAEDDPDKDQLKKAVIAFSKLGKNVFCIQSRLNYYNPQDNLMTKAFTLEYTFWFDYYLEGLDEVGAPIPLGGTSNHFRTKDLLDICGWDPFNVTEDADLGIRIARKGKATHVINSYTYEEANNRLWNWIRQRSRWFKGYMQTYLVHMRNPFKLMRELGFRKFFYFQVTFAGNIFLPMASVLLWAGTLVSLIAPKWLSFSVVYPLNIIFMVNLIVGNIVFVLFNIMPSLFKRDYSLLPTALFLPFYWILIGIGAWRGFFQLVTNPFYWEKTVHGLSKLHKKA
jgi:glycosyltransferase XagB